MTDIAQPTDPMYPDIVVDLVNCNASADYIVAVVAERLAVDESVDARDAFLAAASDISPYDIPSLLSLVARTVSVVGVHVGLNLLDATPPAEP